jgi:hypothetical protein
VTALITPSSDAGRASRRTTDARVRRLLRIVRTNVRPARQRPSRI